MAKPVLTISSKNYGAWALRGWLMARLAGLDFTEKVIPPDDPAMKAEMLLLAPSMLVPSLEHGGIKVWDTLAIGEYLNEIKPKAGLLPADAKARAHCRAICGEMHSGFASLRSALPMNIKAHFPNFKVWSRAQGDIDRVLAIWKECLSSYGGPYLGFFATRKEYVRKMAGRLIGETLDASFIQSSHESRCQPHRLIENHARCIDTSASYGQCPADAKSSRACRARVLACPRP